MAPFISKIILVEQGMRFRIVIIIHIVRGSVSETYANSFVKIKKSDTTPFIFLLSHWLNRPYR